MNPDSEKSSPRLSVVMSVYNGGKYLDEALQSTLGQSFRDFEFIAIDDGSGDDTWAVLSRYAARDPRLVLRRNERNIGLTRSLNLGLELARGGYLARMDADDVCLPGRFAAQVEYLDRNPRVGVVGTSVQVIDEHGNLLYERLSAADDESLKAELLLKNNAFAHGSVMARTELLRQAGGYDEKIPFAQDYDLWCRLKPLTKFAGLQQSLIQWRNRQTGISNLDRRAQLKCSLETSLRNLAEEFKDGSIDREAYRRVWWAYHGFLESYRTGDIGRLGPLWELLASRAGLMQKTNRGFRDLAYALLANSEVRDGIRLLWICGSRLGQKANPATALKSLLKSLLSIKKTKP
ncbi:MAG: glycosyltransferase [Candidatus Glassbacteria bacterium]|nr:glycosyltransferase [Candidatus Glassbacteria bacterium]